MSEHISQSIHPGRNNGLGVRPITGPYNAVAREMALDMMGPHHDLGESVPADVFILSLGEPDSGSCTKIGGIPYWPREREWPSLRNGDPAPFIAQFDFSGSRDIVSGLRYDTLLLFGDAEEEDITAYWETSERDGSRLKIGDVPVPAASRLTYSGTRWRTRNFQDRRRSWNDVLSSSGIWVVETMFATRCLGLQIGCAPCIPPQGLWMLSGERIICSVSNVFVSYNVPFPFLNRPQPVTSDESDQLLWKIAGGLNDDRLSVIYVLEDYLGQLRCVMLDF